MFNFAIIDDNDIDRNKMIEVLDAYCKKNKIKYQKDIYNCTSNFKFDIHYDALFLDIDMPNESGLEFAKRLNQRYHTNIIFITNYTDYMLSTFDVQPFHFMIKEHIDETACHILSLLFEKLKKRNKQIQVKTKKGTETLLVSDIYYIKSDEHECEIHTQDSFFLIWSSISSLYEELKIYNFFMINRSTLVNFSYIKSTSLDKVFLQNNVELSISTRTKSSFKKAYENFIMRNL